MDNKYVYEFCLESTIPGIINALRLNDKSEILNKVIKKANRDALIGARYWDTGYIGESLKYMNTLKKLLEPRTVSPSSEELITELQNSKIGEANLGSIQKLVNMTLKYLYVLEVYGYDTGIEIKPSKCDCPIDSRILKQIGRTDVKWTKLKEYSEYEELQKMIDDSEHGNESRLFFDFYTWTQHND